VKLKQDFPCIRFFDSGETLLSSAGTAYTGINVLGVGRSA
jgi:hypothetical protein